MKSIMASMIGLLLCLPNLRAQTTSQALAPILVGPYDGSDVLENSIVWSWFMQPKASDGSEIICDLKVVEVLDGQSPEEALNLNPLLILKENLTSSVWQTNFAARNFLPGHRYAWRIVAKVKKNERYDIISQSEIWTYTYNVPLKENSEQLASAQTAKDSTYRTASIPQETQNTEKSSTKALKLSGRSRLTTEYNTNAILTQGVDTTFARWQIEPTLTLFGVPLGLNLLVTTEKNTRKSDVSRGTFGSQDTKKGLNLVLQQRLEDAITELEQERDSAPVDSLRQFSAADSIAIANRIAALYELQNKDLSENLEALNDAGIVRGEQELMAQFPSFGFGKVVPQFSRFSFSGVSLNGGMLEYNPGDFYAAAAIGKVQREVHTSQIPDSLADIGTLGFFRNVYSARLGYGRRNGNHIILTGIYSHDDDQSIVMKNILNNGSNSKDIDSLLPNAHALLSEQRNVVLGLSSHYVPDSTDIVFDGEFNISYLKDEDNDLWSKSDRFFGVQSAETVKSIVDALFTNSIHERQVVDFNHAARLLYSFDEKSGHLSAGYRYIGAGFSSIGVAGLRTDVLRADAHYDQIFYKRQFRVSSSYTFEQSGYKKDSLNRSILHSISGGTELRFEGLPVFQMNALCNWQTLELNRFGILAVQPLTEANRLLQFSSSGSYVYGTPSVRYATFLSLTYQEGESRKNDSIDISASGTFYSRMYMITQRIALGEKLSIGANGSYTSTDAADKDTRVWSMDISTLFLPYSWMSFTAGFAKSRDEQSNSETVDRYLSSRISPWEFCDIDIRLNLRTLSPSSTTQSLVRLISTVHW